MIPRAGEKLVLFYASANRDEDVFDAPDELRLDRNPSRHLAFGVGELDPRRAGPSELPA